jgi:hypothetical protein
LQYRNHHSFQTSVLMQGHTAFVYSKQAIVRLNSRTAALTSF